MNLTSPTQVRQLLEKMDFHPSKSLGQNFLIDRNILNILIDGASVCKNDHVLEVGPGLGVLTEELLKKAGNVTAVEKDKRLAQHLREELKDRTNLELIENDILDVDMKALADSGVNKVVANLPYAAGTRAMVDLCNLDNYPELMAVTIQKDVAERLAAKPSTKAYGTVSVLIQTRYETEMIKTIPPTCFVPRPRVQSAIVVCKKRENPFDEGLDRVKLHKLVKNVFLERRKQIGGTLHRMLVRDIESVKEMLSGIDIEPTQRPETLAPEDWCRLFAAL